MRRPNLFPGRRYNVFMSNVDDGLLVSDHGIVRGALSASTRDYLLSQIGERELRSTVLRLSGSRGLPIECRLGENRPIVKEPRTPRRRSAAAMLGCCEGG